MVSSSAGAKRQHYPLIDVLRGFAALLVLWYHVIEIGQWKDFPWTGIALLPRIGWIGVDLFFVLSGFVIGKAAIEASQADPRGWRPVYVERRLRRIVPLYMATLVLFLLLVDPTLLQNGSEAVRHILTHVLFIHNIWVKTAGSINGPNWSVALEMQFYLLMLLATPWVARSPAWKVLVIWVLVAIAWRFASTHFYPPGGGKPMHQQVAATQLPGVLDGFVFGICLAKLALQGRLDYTPRRLVAWCVAAVALVLVALELFWPRAFYWHSWQMITFWRTLLYAAFAAVLAVVVVMPWSGGPWLRPLRYLGEISYGLYLWHVPVLVTLLDKTAWRGPELLAGTVVCTTVLASLSWHGFEKLWMRSARRPQAAGAPDAMAQPLRPLRQRTADTSVAG